MTGLSHVSVLPKGLTDEFIRQTEELTAAYDAAMTRLAQKEKALLHQFQASEEFLNAQLTKFNDFLIDLRTIMTETGVARWRLSSQDVLTIGDLQLTKIQKLSDDTKQTMAESAARFERASESSAKNIYNALHLFKIEVFKKYTEQNYEEVKKNASSVIEKINAIIQKFQWRNILLALGISLIIAVAAGLYMDDEWPWERHTAVIQERNAGRALMTAWPRLSPVDQKYLQAKLSHAK